ncbi:flagellar export protein FliJ [Planctomycetales bacterium]|nr:flagellar export protein FliJ [Planctomycetales bacterium]
MFQFRLDPLITIRDNTLKERQGELAKAYEAHAKVEEWMQEVQKTLTENTESMRQAIQKGGAIDVNYLLGVQRQEMFLKSERTRFEGMMKEIDEEIEKRRQAVMQANKELKIVEKLKEKRYEKYISEENLKESKMLDEVAGNIRRH